MKLDHVKDRIDKYFDRSSDESILDGLESVGIKLDLNFDHLYSLSDLNRLRAYQSYLTRLLIKRRYNDVSFIIWELINDKRTDLSIIKTTLILTKSFINNELICKPRQILKEKGEQMRGEPYV